MVVLYNIIWVPWSIINAWLVSKDGVTSDSKPKEWSAARFGKTKYPNKEDWNHVRFSDECHYQFGPQEILRIIRKAMSGLHTRKQS